MELAKNLLFLCNERGLSLSELARLCLIPKSTLHGWTTGSSVHDLNDLKKICAVLEVNFYSLVFGSSDPFDFENETMEELFSGDIRLTIHKVIKSKKE
jgi:transcriptional regulator with XRE-family HTH domain